MTYSSGLASFHAIMTLLAPKRIFIDEDYHGVHRSTKLQHRLIGIDKLTLEDLNQLGRETFCTLIRHLIPLGKPATWNAMSQSHVRLGLTSQSMRPLPLRPCRILSNVVSASSCIAVPSRAGGRSYMLCGVLVAHHVRKEWVGTCIRLAE